MTNPDTKNRSHRRKSDKRINKSGHDVPNSRTPGQKSDRLPSKPATAATKNRAGGRKPGQQPRRLKRTASKSQEKRPKSGKATVRSTRRTPKESEASDKSPNKSGSSKVTAKGHGVASKRATTKTGAGRRKSSTRAAPTKRDAAKTRRPATRKSATRPKSGRRERKPAPVEPIDPAPKRATWRALRAELDRWQAEKRLASFWWRDDDAEAPSTELDRLLALSLQSAAGETRTRAIPLALAVVPAGADAALAERLKNLPQVAVLQHGWAHANHAPPERKTVELGPERPVRTVMRELEKGRDRLRALFRNRFLPVMVPPWNRIAPDIARTLPRHGFSGLSTAGPRRGARITGVAGYRIANVHIDIFQWRPRARFIGTEAALAQAIGHLAARRQRLVDIDEPTGLMTHHRQHDAGCWRFIDRFLSETASHPAARWLPADGIFPAMRTARSNRRGQGQP